MEDSFDLLEEKVRKAAELVRRLRRENESLSQDLDDAKGRIADAEEKLEKLESELSERDSGGADSEELASELGDLREEREEIRRRLAKIVEVLDGLD